jgi:Leucine-rich repeat (LRR) protein
MFEFIIHITNYLLNSIYPNFMYPFDVYTYLNSLSEDVEIIDLSNENLTSLPDLSRFYNLQELYIYCNRIKQIHSLPSTLRVFSCRRNYLTLLPPLPPNLEFFNCTVNQLTSLPALPLSLHTLYCNNNNLTSLPQLPPNLKIMHCWENQLTSMPCLPPTMLSLHCNHNRLYSFYYVPENLELIFDHNPIYDAISFPDQYHNLLWYKEIRVLNQFKHLYYSLKFKKQFRDWLWVKVRELRIREKYNPSYLLENVC